MYNHFLGATAANSSRKGLSTTSVVVIVLLVAALSSFVTYLIVKDSETTKREKIISQKDKDYNDLSEKMDRVSQQLADKIKEAKKLGADYKELEQYKTELENDLANLQKNAQITQYQLNQYLSKVQNYEQVIAAKDKELAQLREENTRLSGENEQLSTDKDSLLTETADLSSSLDEATDENRVLTDVASSLKAQNINVIAYNKRAKEESKNVFRAKRIDRLDISMIIAANSVAQTGSKTLYLRLVEPSGAVVFNSALGSGQFNLDGSSTSFTLKKDISYSGSAQNVKFSFEKPGDYNFKEGSYKVELFSEGKPIGLKVFRVD